MIRQRLFVSVATVLFALGGSAVIAAEKSHAELLAQTKVSEADATKTALAQVPNGKILSSELEEEHGRLIWSFDISRPNSKNTTEINVDAKSGKIVNKVVETPAAEKKEAAGEKKEEAASKKPEKKN
jgi:hypothetical protein